MGSEEDIAVAGVGQLTGFRPTLVGSEVPQVPRDGQRSQFQTNPRGVGGTPHVRRLCSRSRFRPTLVGSEERTIVEGELKNNGFRPTLVGSEGSLPRLGKSPDRRFQTNPRGVGGSTVPVCA